MASLELSNGRFFLPWLKLPLLCMCLRNLHRKQQASQGKPYQVAIPTETDIKSDGGHASAQHFIVHKRVQVIDLFKKCVVKSRHCTIE